MGNLPEINYEKFLNGTRTQVELNRLKNAEKDQSGKNLDLWALILGRPFGNLMAAVEDKSLDDVEKYVYQVSAVLAEIHGYIEQHKK
jgi:hypothetical protein